MKQYLTLKLLSGLQMYKHLYIFEIQYFNVPKTLKFFFFLNFPELRYITLIFANYI